MNENGVPAPSDRASDYMTTLSVAQLAKLAERGDARAATIGAEKAMAAAYKTAEGRAALDAMGAGNPAGDDADWATEDKVMQALFATQQWQQQRGILWSGVIHGSSFAALMMARTYVDLANTCLLPTKCMGWLLVAWRMGEWEVGAQSEFQLPPGTERSLFSSFIEANILWTKINVARSQLGLPPLDLDLRPNFSLWHSLTQSRIDGEPDKTVPVYPR